MMGDDSAYGYAIELLCTYCGVLADTVDHTVPRWLLSRAEAAGVDLFRMFRMRRWVVPACRECNSALGNRIFPTLALRREHVKTGIRRRHARWLAIPDWDDEALAEMGPVARQDIRLGIAKRDALRARLAYDGCRPSDHVDFQVIYATARQALGASE